MTRSRALATRIGVIGAVVLLLATAWTTVAAASDQQAAPEAPANVSAVTALADDCASGGMPSVARSATGEQLSAGAAPFQVTPNCFYVCWWVPGGPGGWVQLCYLVCI